MKRIAAALQAAPGTPPWPLRLEETYRLLEYRYMKANPGTQHDQFLDLPMDHIRWTIRIDDLHKDEEARRNKSNG